MSPAIEIADRNEYKARMNALLELDPQRTVVLTIDMQRDYLDLEIASNPVAAQDADRVLRHAQRLLESARRVGVPVIHVYTTRRPFELQGGLSGTVYGRVGRLNSLSQNAQAGIRRIPDRLEGSPQAQVPAVLVAPTDIHIPSKKTMDGFLGTELDLLLQRATNADAVVLGGINTDSCVLSTAFSAANRGYKTVVVSDCVASTRGTDHHRMALELMSRSFAWVLTAEQVMDRLGS